MKKIMKKEGDDNFDDENKQYHLENIGWSDLYIYNAQVSRHVEYKDN
jgi:hypothetical protein